MKNHALVTAERPPPGLAAARRNVQKLTAQLAQTSGELFAGDPAGLTGRLREAQAVVRAGEERLHVVPDTFRPAPAVAELLDRWRTAHAVATSPGRPAGPGPLQTQAQASLRDATESADQLAHAGAMLPPEYRAPFADAIQAEERQKAFLCQHLAELADPAHPAAVAVRAWDLRHQNADLEMSEAWEILDYELTEWAVSPGLDWLPPLLPSVSAADRVVWVTAAAETLAYRERWSVVESSPLGAEPWAESQKAEWDEARAALAQVGVHVTSATEVAAQAATPGRSRRSLAAVLAGVTAIGASR